MRLCSQRQNFIFPAQVVAVTTTVLVSVDGDADELGALIELDELVALIELDEFALEPELVTVTTVVLAAPALPPDPLALLLAFGQETQEKTPSRTCATPLASNTFA